PRGSLQVPQAERDERPWLLIASYHHPHEPFLTPQKYWDMYEDAPIDPVTVPASAELPSTVMDEWVNTLHGVDGVDLGDDEAVYRMRRAYFGLVSYIDDKLGELLDTLEETGQSENTIVVFTSDHGDMLGERGMVQKRTFYEWSARVPFIVGGAPIRAQGRVSDTPVSLIDLVPTVCEMVGLAPIRPGGRSLLRDLDGVGLGAAPGFADYHSEGVYSPCWRR